MLLLAIGLACSAGTTLTSQQTAQAQATWPEKEGHHGADTFLNYHNASGMGPRVQPFQIVNVSCKVYDPYIQSANPDGYWYRLSDSPWNDQYYAVANTFYNGDPESGPYSHNTDYNVPDCDSTPTQAPSTAPPTQVPAASPPAVSLAQGAQAPDGYRYAITLDGFAANSRVTASCRDSVSPDGFYDVSVPTDGNGHGSISSSSCYSNDGPDHWVVANGVESNHVAWAPRPVPSSAGPTSSDSLPPLPPTDEPPASGSSASPEVCQQVSGATTPASGISDWLLGRFESGYTTPVVIPWTYFSGNPSFVARATQLDIHEKVVWQASFPSDMYFALGHFTISHDSLNCYSIYDLYDYSPYFLPLWLQQKVKSAVPFDVASSGKL